MKRRDFIVRSGALALGTLALAGKQASAWMPASALPAPGLQLYTVMGVIDKDLDGTLKRLSEMGYRNLESAFSMKGGFYGLSATEFASKAKSFGLSWQAHHTMGAPFKMPAGAKPPVGADGKPMVIPPMKNLRDNAQEIVDGVAAGGVKYLVCASTPLDTWDEVKQSTETLAKTGELCRKAGIGFAYHNHTKEFEKVEGQVPFDYMAAQLSPKEVKFELDLAWATKAGINPVELFRKHPGRFPLWHVKDLDKASFKPVEIGAGYIDFKPIFENASVSGLEYYFVEQDQAPAPLDNLNNSLQALRKLI